MESFHAKVERNLGRSSREIEPAAATVNLRETTPGHWGADLEVDANGRRARRQFEGESCEAVAEAAAVIVALSVETAPAEPAEPRGAERRVGPATTASASPDAAKTVSGGNASPSVWQLGAVLDAGTMPSQPGVGIEAAAARTWTGALTRWRLVTGLSFFPRQENSPDNLSSDPSAGRYWLFSFSVRGCVTTARRRFELGPCLGAEVDLMHATSIGGGSARSDQAWVSPVGSLLATFALTSRTRLFARTEIAIPTTRRSFVGDPNVTVRPLYTIAAVAWRGAVGLEVTFL